MRAPLIAVCPVLETREAAEGTRGIRVGAETVVYLTLRALPVAIHASPSPLCRSLCENQALIPPLITSRRVSSLDLKIYFSCLVEIRDTIRCVRALYGSSESNQK